MSTNPRSYRVPVLRLTDVYSGDSVNGDDTQNDMMDSDAPAVPSAQQQTPEFNDAPAQARPAAQQAPQPAPAPAAPQAQPVPTPPPVAPVQPAPAAPQAQTQQPAQQPVAAPSVPAAPLAQAPQAPAPAAAPNLMVPPAQPAAAPVQPSGAPVPTQPPVQPVAAAPSPAPIQTPPPTPTQTQGVVVPPTTPQPPAAPIPPQTPPAAPTTVARRPTPTPAAQAPTTSAPQTPPATMAPPASLEQAVPLVGITPPPTKQPVPPAPQPKQPMAPSAPAVPPAPQPAPAAPQVQPVPTPPPAPLRTPTPAPLAQEEPAEKKPDAPLDMWDAASKKKADEAQNASETTDKASDPWTIRQQKEVSDAPLTSPVVPDAQTAKKQAAVVAKAPLPKQVDPFEKKKTVDPLDIWEQAAKKPAPAPVQKKAPTPTPVPAAPAPTPAPVAPTQTAAAPTAGPADASPTQPEEAPEPTNKGLIDKLLGMVIKDEKPVAPAEDGPAETSEPVLPPVAPVPAAQKAPLQTPSATPKTPTPATPKEAPAEKKPAAPATAAPVDIWDKAEEKPQATPKPPTKPVDIWDQAEATQAPTTHTEEKPKEKKPAAPATAAPVDIWDKAENKPAPAPQTKEKEIVKEPATPKEVKHVEPKPAPAPPKPAAKKVVVPKTTDAVVSDSKTKKEKVASKPSTSEPLDIWDQAAKASPTSPQPKPASQEKPRTEDTKPAADAPRGALGNLAALRDRVLSGSAGAEETPDAVEGKADERRRALTHTDLGDVKDAHDLVHTESSQALEGEHAQALAGVAKTLQGMQGGETQTTAPGATPPEATEAKPKAPVRSAVPMIRTFKSDVEQTMHHDKVSMVKMIADEQNRRAKESDVSVHHTHKKHFSVQSYLLVGVSVVLLIAAIAIGVVVAVILTKPQVNEPTNALFFADTELPYDMTGQDRTAILQGLTKVRDTIEMQYGDVAELLPTERIMVSGFDTEQTTSITAPEFIARTRATVPASFTRALNDSWILGLHQNEHTHPFIVFRTDSHENVFAGMLEWEANMDLDLAPLFGAPLSRTVAAPAPAATSTASTTDELPEPAPLATVDTREIGSFDDISVANIPARVLVDSDGEEQLIWSQPDSSTVIITTNTDSLREIRKRMQAR